MTNTNRLPFDRLSTGQLQALDAALANLLWTWARVQLDFGETLPVIEDVRSLRTTLMDALEASDALDFGSFDADFTPVFSPDDAITELYAVEGEALDATQPVIVPEDTLERMRQTAAIRGLIDAGRYQEADVAIAVLLGFEVVLEQDMYVMQGATTQPLPRYTTRYNDACQLRRFVPMVTPALPTPQCVVETFLSAWELQD